MDFPTLITSHQSQTESISILQKLIFDVTEDNYEETKQSICLSQDISDKESLRHVLASLGAAFHTRPKITDVIMKLIISVSKPAMKFFPAHELFAIFCADLSHFLLLKLIQNDFFPFDSLFSIPLIKDSSFTMFFGPELIEYDKASYEKMVNDILHVDFDEHKKLRDIGENHTIIATLIRTNDAAGFVEYVSKCNIPLDSKIPTSIYEKCYFVNNEPTLFEYAAFCGSVDVFKYMISNKVPPTVNLSRYAVAGGNIEIIHLCEGIKCSFENALDMAIWNHRNDIIEYFADQGIEFTYQAPIYCVLGYNYEYFYKTFHNQIKNFNMHTGDHILIYAVKHMLLEFGIAITSLNEFDLNRTDSETYLTPLHYAVLHNNIDIVQELIKLEKTDTNCVDRSGNSPLHLAMKGDIQLIRLICSSRNIDRNLHNFVIFFFHVFILMPEFQKITFKSPLRYAIENNVSPEIIHDLRSIGLSEY